MYIFYTMSQAAALTYVCVCRGFLELPCNSSKQRAKEKNTASNEKLALTAEHPATQNNPRRNLVPRVLGRFGQRVKVRRDYGIMDSIFPELDAR